MKDSSLSKNESNNKWIKLILNSLNDIIFLLDNEFKVVKLNEYIVEKITNYSRNDILNKKFQDFIYDKDIEIFTEFIKNLTINNQPFVEIRLMDKKNKKIWFELKGKTFLIKSMNVHYLFLLKNITDMKTIEKKYKNLFENSPNSIIILNFSGIILDVNKATIKMFNYDKQDIINKPIHEFNELYTFNLKSYFKQIFKAAFIGDFPEPIEVELKLRNSIKIWVLIQASLVKVNKSVMIQLLFQDITGKKNKEILEFKFKKQLELEVNQRTKELNKALNEQKLYLDQIFKSSQFKSEFMSTMSHELRTPLNAIIGFTDLLLEGAYGSLNTDQKEILYDIKFSSELQFEMIKNILDISKIEAGKLKLNRSEIIINHIINDVVSLFKPELKNKNIQIQIKGLNKEKIVFADPIQMREIFLNLISNAIKFTEEGKIEIIFNEELDEWIITIKDTGIGIQEKDFNIIFKEFCRVDSEYVRSKKGTGLGLSLTKRLISLHGGDIWFESKFGKGTKFIFSIPKIDNMS